MNPLIEAFKECCLQAGEICGFTQGKLIRKFGLDDFLANSLTDDDDASTIGVKTFDFFCADATPHEDQFKFAVLAVGIFLSERANQKDLPKQALRDLVAILGQGINEDKIRRWIASNF
jgi:hypothetical protein